MLYAQDGMHGEACPATAAAASVHADSDCSSSSSGVGSFGAATATAAPVAAAAVAAPVVGVKDTRAAAAAAGIAAGAPVVFRVGAMGEDYWRWVNTPEPGVPRFFASALAEACSQTPWWVVPLVWLPLFAGVQAYCATALAVPVAALLAWAAAGVVAWQGLEYAIHRFVFHADLTSYWGITFHFLFHGCHHKYPKDALRLVFPPLPASALVAAVFVALRWALPPYAALPLFAGMGEGYVAYDCLHYAIHHCRAGRGVMALAPLRALQRRHMHHHFKDHAHGYGISSMLYDLLLGTLARL